MDEEDNNTVRGAFDIGSVPSLSPDIREVPPAVEGGDDDAERTLDVTRDLVPIRLAKLLGRDNPDGE